MRVLIALLGVLALAAAAPKNPQRIVGGDLTTIDQYPDMVSVMWSWTGENHVHNCGGVILNNRAVLTAAHCTIGDQPFRWRCRVGSTFPNIGGVVHLTSHVINHPQYSSVTYEHDISIIRTSTNIGFTNVIQQARIPGTNYNLGDNEVVWATGYGRLYSGGPLPEQLRHVQIWTVNQAVCGARYAELNATVTDNMFCAGWLDVGGRDTCQGDSGGPIYHNGVVVGVCSWAQGCAEARYPGVNTRVSRYTQWILANA
ncbi:unnamed protein product [Diatraea saccharalis]|uniref:Peptidase S1 domain-containing protein n=1 Tax=Diatraea saccharalis TaxID=40085 RepID=A0A9N9RHN8_9NEOP|nr:unnamed protein product [Diatraea saccharalis]